MSQQDERDLLEERFNANLLQEEGPATEPPFHVEIWHDEDTESPNEHEGLFKLVSFLPRHNSYRDPSEIFGCEVCGEGKQDQYHGGGPALEGESPDDYHDYEPKEEVAFVLNYFEHGLCRWYVAPSASPVDMRWDGAYGAGVLLLNVNNQKEYFAAEINSDNRNYWDTLTDEQKREAAESFTDEYTAWSNGETYGYTITRRAGTCPTCHRENEKEVLDSCGGFIVGSESREYFQEEILFSLAAELGVRIPQVTDPDYETAPKLKDLIKVGEQFTYQDPFGGDWF